MWGVGQPVMKTFRKHLPRDRVLDRLRLHAHIAKSTIPTYGRRLRYGCATARTSDGQVLDLAADVYERVFMTGWPTPHILLRDYARGVIERALELGELKIDIRKVRPPYKSQWPRRIPTKKQLEKHGVWTPDMPDSRIARSRIYESVMALETSLATLLAPIPDTSNGALEDLANPRRRKSLSAL